MPAQSYEIGTLLESVQSKGQSISSNYQTKRQSYEPEMIKSQEKVQNFDTATNIVSSLISTGVNIYTSEKQRILELKNKNDITEGSLALNNLGLDITKALNDDANKGLLKYDTDGNIDMANSQTLFDNYTESVLNSEYSDDVKDALISQATTNFAKSQQDAQKFIMNRESANLKKNISTTLDNAIVSDSSNLTDTGYTQFNKSLESFRDLISPEQYEEYKANGQGIINQNRGESIASSIALTEGKSSALYHIANDTNITDKKTARSKIDQAISDFKAGIDSTIQNVYQNYPDENKIFVNGNKVINYNNAIAQARDQYSNASPEMQEYAVSKIKQYQEKDIADLKIFKTDSEYDIMQPNEVKQAQYNMQDYVNSGLLEGKDSKIASNWDKMSAILEANGKEAVQKNKAKLIKSADLLKYTSNDDISSYQDTLTSSYGNGEITANEYASALSDIDEEKTRRETVKTEYMDKQIENLFKNDAQLDQMDDVSLTSFSDALSERNENGEFVGYEKEYANQVAAISKAQKTKTELAIADKAAKEKADIDDKTRKDEEEKAELATQINFQNGVINSVTVDFNLGNITAEDGMLRILGIKDSIKDINVSNAYKKLFDNLIDGNNSIPTASKVPVKNMLANANLMIKDSLGYAKASTEEKPELELRYNEISQYIQAYTMDRYRDYDGSVSSTKYLEETNENITKMITSKLYDGYSLLNNKSKDDIKEAKGLVYFSETLNKYQFATEEVEKNFNDFSTKLNTTLEKEGIKTKAGIPAIPKIDEEGNSYAKPVLQGEDGNFYSIEGKDILVLDRKNNKWVSYKDEDKDPKSKNSKGLLNFVKNIEWGVQ